MKNRKTQTRFYDAKNPGELAEITKKIENSFRTLKENTVSRKQQYLDSFDLRLFKKNLTLCLERRKYSLINLENNFPEEHQTVKGNKRPSFWQEFPEGRLKDKLKSLLDIRALIHLLTIERTQTHLKILNKDDKTVLNVFFNRIYRSEGGEKFPLKYEVQVDPVRGYDEEFEKVTNIFSDSVLGENSQNLVKNLIENKVNEEGICSSKLDIELTPNMTALEAAKTVYYNLLETIRQNEEGIKRDTDTEFLHDFRVAIRRIRSTLSLIKGVFPKRDVKKFKKDFSFIGKKTNRLRDIDVYLLKKNSYTRMLSEDLGSGLNPVFQKLYEERKTEQKQLAKYLETDSYRKILNSFENYLDYYSPGHDTPEGTNKAEYLAKRSIWKRYEQIIKNGCSINDNSPDPELHKLRIECKKLRYLLEFFSSIFPKKEMSSIIKKLKKLQDNLGDFNDLYVQQEDLKEFIEDFDHDSEHAQKVSVSVGGLIAVLYQKQKEVRKEFSKSFESFNNRETRKLFEKLFKNGDEDE